MTHKFTHPDDAEPGHEWVRADGPVLGLAAKHLSGAGWAVQTHTGEWLIYFPAAASKRFMDKPKNHETEVWVNCYHDGSVGAHLTKNRATAFAFGGVIARVRVPFSWTEGQFDE